MLGTFGKSLLLLGLVIVAIGLLLIVADRYPGLKIGRLPGDIYIERDGFRFYFPIVTSILLSLLLSLLLWFLNRK